MSVADDVPGGEALALLAAAGELTAERGTPTEAVVTALERLAEHAPAAIDRIGMHDAPWAPTPGSSRPWLA